MDIGVQRGTGRETRYYTALGRASDCLLRCKDCKALVLLSFLQTHGCCACGNKRVAEITTLNQAEMAHVLTLDFPYKDEFLKEFTAHE